MLCGKWQSLISGPTQNLFGIGPLPMIRCTKSTPLLSPTWLWNSLAAVCRPKPRCTRWPEFATLCLVAPVQEKQARTRLAFEEIDSEPTVAMFAWKKLLVPLHVPTVVCVF